MPSREQLQRWSHHRAQELAPVLEAIDTYADVLGWSVVRDVIMRHVYQSTEVPKFSRRGSWRRRIGTRNGAKILAELDTIEHQGRLF